MPVRRLCSVAPLSTICHTSHLYYSVITGKSDLETPSWHSPDKLIAAIKPDYKHNETAQGLMSSTIGTNTSLDMSDVSFILLNTDNGGKTVQCYSWLMTMLLY